MPFHFNWRVELHPVVVHFPIALLCLALLFDVVGWLWKAQSFRSAGLYCLVAGAIGTALSVVSGLVTPEAREREGREGIGAVQPHLSGLQNFFSGRPVKVHEHWGYVLLILVVLWLAARVAAHLGQHRRPGLAMTAGALTIIVLVITGYYGGELVYRQRERGRGAGDVIPGIERATHTRDAGSLRRSRTDRSALTNPPHAGVTGSGRWRARPRARGSGPWPPVSRGRVVSRARTARRRRWTPWRSGS